MTGRPKVVPGAMQETPEGTRTASYEPPCDTCDRTTCWCAKAGLLDDALDERYDLCRCDDCLAWEDEHGF